MISPFAIGICAGPRSPGSFAARTVLCGRLDLSPDGKHLAAAGEDTTIRIWDLDRASNPLQLKGHTRNIWEVQFSPDGKTLASGSFDSSARLWDATTGRSLRHAGRPSRSRCRSRISARTDKFSRPGRTIRPFAGGACPTARRCE